MKPFRISLQLYTIREETAKDFLGACQRVADMGYEWVELAGLGGVHPYELRSEFDKFGIGISGAHVGEDAFLDFDKVANENRELGNNEVTIAWLPEKYRDSRSAWENTAKTLEEAARKYRGQGLSLGFHNHQVEFDIYGGKSGLDILLENAPSLNIQLDVFWAQKGGEDPVELIPKLSGRLPSVHMKDLGADGEDIEFGEGLLDWPHIIEACEHAGVQTLVMEMDNPLLAPLESAEVCLKNIQRLLVGG